MEVKRVKKKLAVSSGSSSSSDRTYVFAAPVAAAGAGALRAAQRVGGVVLDAIEPDGDEAARVEPGHRGEVVVAGSWGGGGEAKTIQIVEGLKSAAKWKVFSL